MPMMMGDLRAALVEAGASEALASKAATEAASRDIRIAGMGAGLPALTAMSGPQLAMLVTLLFKVFHG